MVTAPGVQGAVTMGLGVREGLEQEGSQPPSPSDQLPFVLFVSLPLFYYPFFFIVVILLLSLVLFSWARKSLWMVTAAMKLKDTCSLKESYDKPRQHIKKQRCHFADKGPSSQSYGFSSSHVWT